MGRSGESNGADTIKRVRDRLEFVSIITGLNSQFLDPSLVKVVGEAGWTHPWVQFDSLRNYLLLTCFDMLGQRDSHVDFQSWLSAKKNRPAGVERENVISRLGYISRLASCIDPARMVAKLHRKYLDLYGTKTSFYRFVNDTL